MSYEIALVNPRAKPRKRKSRGVKVAKRKRRKMTAKQLKYFGGGRKRRRRSRARRKSTAVAVSAPRRANPRRRRRSHAVTSFKRRRRSNPRLGGNGVVGQVVSTIMPAAIGAAGVLAVDRVIGYLPVANLVSDPNMKKHVNRAVRLLAVAGVGVAARKFLGNETGRGIAQSAMGIAIHGLLSGFLGSGAGLSGDLDGDDMGAYLQGDWQATPASVISGDMDGDDIAPLISGDMDGLDPLGADDMGALDPLGAYLQGDND